MTPLGFTAEALLLRGLEYVRAGVPYIWGGKSPLSGLDCSGFVTDLLWELSGRRVDWRATHNTDRLWAEVPRVGTDERRWGLVPGHATMATAAPRPGDLVFYWGPSSRGPQDVEHVMVLLCMTSPGQGLVLGMPFGGSQSRDANNSRKAGHVARVQRWAYRHDVAGICRPPYAATA